MQLSMLHLLQIPKPKPKLYTESMFLKKYQQWVYVALLLVTLAFACYLRLTQIYERTQWFDDSARDITVAKKIFESGTIGTVRPFAASSNGYLSNSILYYNLLAFFWAFGQQPLSVILGFTFLGVLSLGAGWEIGRQIGGKWLGLLCLFALGSNLGLAQQQLSVYQRNLLPSIALVIVMLSLWVWRCPSLRRVVALQIIFTLGFLLHYGLLTLAPAVSLVSLWAFFKNNQSIAKKSVVYLGSATLCMVLWSGLTFSNPFNLFSFSAHAGIEVQASVSQTFQLHADGIFSFLSVVFAYSTLNLLMTWAWLFTFLAATVVTLARKVSAPFTIYFGYLFTYALTHLFFLKASQAFLASHFYSLQYQALAILLLPIAVFLILKHVTRSKTQWVIVGSILWVAFMWSQFYDVAQLPVTDEFSESRRIALLIDQDYGLLRHQRPYYQNFTLTDHTSWATPGWFTPAFVFFLEEKYQTSFAALRPDHNNLQYTFTYPADVVYLVCHRWKTLGEYDTSQLAARTLCLQPFIETYLVNYMSADPSKVESIQLMTGTENMMGVNVFRITRPTSEGDFAY